MRRGPADAVRRSKRHGQFETEGSSRVHVMDYGGYPYEEPYARKRRRVNYFAWTVAIVLLSGFALAAWLGSFYIFDQPERPDSYRILQRLHKIDPPKRFELTAAPAGEFLTAQQLYDRYIGMGSAELARANAELARNYIRNYQQVRGLVPYVVGKYTIVAMRELGPDDVFTSGMVALTNAGDSGELLMEHLYPANPEVLPLMKQTLNVGLEVKLERTHDLSAVIHAERLPDGRIMITAVPLLYGSYTVTRGLGTFRLQPPLSLNLAAGWPLFKSHERSVIEQHYAEYRQKAAAIQQGGPVPIPGLSQSATPPPAQNELVRVEEANATSESYSCAGNARSETRRAKSDSNHHCVCAHAAARHSEYSRCYTSASAESSRTCDSTGSTSSVCSDCHSRTRSSSPACPGRDCKRSSGLQRWRRQLENISTWQDAARQAHRNSRPPRCCRPWTCGR